MTVQQVEQPDRAYPNGVPTDIPLRRRPKVGDRFGELTVIKYIGLRRRDRCRLWLLRCDCGRTALRTTGALNQSVRDLAGGNERILVVLDELDRISRVHERALCNVELAHMLVFKHGSKQFRAGIKAAMEKIMSGGDE